MMKSRKFTILAHIGSHKHMLKDLDLWPGDRVTVLSPLKATKLECVRYVIGRDGKPVEVS